MMEDIPEDKLKEIGDELLNWLEKDDAFLESLNRMAKKDSKFLDYFRKMIVLELRANPETFRKFLMEIIEQIRRDNQPPKFKTVAEMESYIDKEAEKRADEIIKKRDKRK